MKKKIKSPIIFDWFCGPLANKKSAIGIYAILGISALSSVVPVRQHWHRYKAQKLHKFFIEYIVWSFQLFFLPSKYFPIFYVESLLLIPTIFPFFRRWGVIVHHVSKNDPTLQDTIHHSHSFFGKMQYRLQPYFYSSLKRAQEIIVVSEHTRADVIALGVNPSKITFIPNALSRSFYEIRRTEEEKISLRKNYNIPEDAFVFLLFGSDDPRKNFLSFFQSLPFWFKKEFHIVKFGKGVSNSYREECKNYVKQLNLDSQITWIETAQNDQIEDIYLLSDVLVFPSLFEGFGRPPVEAQALGIPVISSWNSGLMDSLSPGSFHTLTNPNDPHIIAQDILCFLDLTPSEKALLVQDGRRNAQRFHEDVIAQLWRNWAERVESHQK